MALAGDRASPFPHTRLDAWHIARQARKVAYQFTLSMPKGFAQERHQINDAAASVVRNIAEGASRYQPGDKIHRFEIAAGEVGEAVSAVLSCTDIGVGDQALAAELEVLMGRVAAMLTGLIQRQRKRHR